MIHFFYFLRSGRSSMDVLFRSFYWRGWFLCLFYYKIYDFSMRRGQWVGQSICCFDRHWKFSTYWSFSDLYNYIWGKYQTYILIRDRYYDYSASKNHINFRLRLIRTFRALCFLYQLESPAEHCYYLCILLFHLKARPYLNLLVNLRSQVMKSRTKISYHLLKWAILIRICKSTFTLK